MKEKQLQGKRYIGLVRCSSAGQIDTSIDAQTELLKQYAQEHGIICAGTVELAGVSGSIPGIRTDIDSIIRRKREQNDFEVVLLQDTTRFTRAGVFHGGNLLYRLREVGLQVVFVKDDLPDGELGDAMRGLQFLSAKEQVRSLAFAVARGQSMSQKEDRSAHCKAPPYGVDRLYTDENRTPKHIIRNLADGTQQKLHPETGAVLETFGRNAKSGVPAHYLKQKTERIVLVPGHPDHVAVVRGIFERHHRDGWGYHRIAQELNNRGTPSPRGGLWSTQQVRTILVNPVYLGTGLANMRTSALFYSRGKDGPVERDGNSRNGAHGRPRPEVRPGSDWVQRAEPHLASLIDASIQPAADAKQRARLDALAAGRPSGQQRSRHTNTEFILSGILTSRQGGHPMTGRRTGKAGRKWRSYAISKAFATPSSTLPRTMIAAEPLEQAILNHLVRLLKNSSRLHPHIQKIATQMVAERAQPDVLRTKLQSEREALNKRIRFAVANLDDLGMEAVKTDVRVWQERIRAIDGEIKRLGTASTPLGDPAAIADAVCRHLDSLGERLAEMPPAALRDVLRLFVAKLEVDLVTKAVEVEFAIPDWGQLDLGSMCLTGKPVYKSSPEAHRFPVLKMRLCYANRQYGRCSRAA